MLNTINGLDLVLIIIITILGFKVYNLTRECKSYVEQIIQISWELQEETQANETMTTGLTNIMNELVVPLQKLVNHHNECNCKDCYIRVKPPAEFIRKCTAPDPMLCDCDDCWLIPTKYS
jgi:hypothetical protein